jgi:hypothetical protein
MIQLPQALFEGWQIQMALFARVEGGPELVDPRVRDACAGVGVHCGPAIFGLSWLWVAAQRGRQLSNLSGS